MVWVRVNDVYEIRPILYIPMTPVKYILISYAKICNEIYITDTNNSGSL